MEPTRAMRASGAAGLLSAVLILGGLYNVSTGTPGRDADPQAWAAWAERGEGAIETGVYYLLVPGLLLFLCMFAALARLLPAAAIATRLAGYGALSFFVLFATSGVLWSTAASSFGFFSRFEDPAAVTVYTGYSAGYHLQGIGVWTLAMTMLASAIGLRSSGALPSWLFVATIILAALAVAGTLIGVGIIVCLIWIVAVGIGLLGWMPERGAAINPAEPPS